MSRVPHFVLVVRDAVLRGRLEAVAHEAGANVTHVSSPEALDPAEAPTVIVVELELPSAVDAIAHWKSSWPRCFIGGSVALPRQDLWNAGLAAGCALVGNRGAIDRQLRKRLAERGTEEGLAVRRLRLRLKERAGDGFVGNLPDAPDGPIAVFRVGSRLYAIDDTCPHARASLADGVLEGTVLTCRHHGSQFDVCTGARVRGPSDFPIRTHRVVEDQGALWVEVS